MEYTLAAAAEVSGVAKTTLFRAIKSGRLSAKRLDDKTYRIDASELTRVYPPVPTQHLDATTGNVPQREKRARNAGTLQASEVELAVLRTKLEAAEAQLGRERETVDDLRNRLDQEQEERRNLQRQLAAPTQPMPQPAQESPAVVEEMRRRLEEAEAHIQTLVMAATPAPSPASAEETSAMVEEQRRRLEELEARNQALMALVVPQAAKEQPSELPAGITSPGPLQRILGRLLGR